MSTTPRTRAHSTRRMTLAATSAALALAACAASPAAASDPASGATPAPTVAPEGQAASKLVVDGRVADRNSLRGDGVSARAVAKGMRGRGVVRLQVRRLGATRWRQVRAVRVRNGQRVSLRWRGDRPGRYLTRIVVRDDGRVAIDRLGATYVYRATFASWYGPGFIGNRTACGQRLTSSIMGVAHKTLPCGTRVTFHLRGRTVTARVIDRGPYAHGRDWDLTPALKRKLRFGSTGTVHTTS